MDTISVIIQTYNESANITECIHSAKLLTNNIIVVDTESTDNTNQLAKKNGAVVYTHPYEQYVEPVRNYAMSKAESDWVFILDADERMTQELAGEIPSRITHEKNTYYKVPRKEYFAKKVWLSHGGWWPNHIIRLIKKDSFVDWPAAIHSTPQITGSMGMLNNAILHFSKNDYSDIVNKTIMFENMESELLYKANKPVSVLTFFRKFFGELNRRLIKKQGYKDGTIGIIESMYQAFSKTITYLYLYEKKKSSAL